MIRSARWNFFVIAPSVRYAGQPAEQATLFVHDFSGNAIEIKSFRDPEAVFAPAAAGAERQS